MRQLVLKHIMEYGIKCFPNREIACKLRDGMFRYTYSDFDKRVRRCCNVMGKDLGVRQGDVVATLALDTYQHLEVDFATQLSGAIWLALMEALPKENFIYLSNKAKAKFFFIDEEFVPFIEEIKDELKMVKGYVIMTDKEKLPKTKLSPVYSYEELMRQASPDYIYPDFDEYTPCQFLYSSGVTGLPKMTLYNHRHFFLSALICQTAGSMWGYQDDDVVLICIPLYYMNSWQQPLAIMVGGANMVLPGRTHWPNAKVLLELVKQEKVTRVYGHGFAWTDIVHVLEKEKYDLSSIKMISLAANTPVINKFFRDNFGIPVMHGWGSCETSPAGVLQRIPPEDYAADLPEEEKRYYLGLKMFPLIGMDYKVLNEKGEEVKHNGIETGRLWTKSFPTVEEYYEDPERTAIFFDKDGYVDTGDYYTVDEHGCLEMAQRVVELIKCGEEEINSVTLEVALSENPAVYEAIVIGIEDEKLGQKPLPIMTLKEDYKGKVTKEEILKSLGGKVKKSWIPDDILFVDKIPKTASGKRDKRLVGGLYKEGKLKEP